MLLQVIVLMAGLLVTAAPLWLGSASTDPSELDLALIRAARQGDIERTTDLLDQGANVQ